MIIENIVSNNNNLVIIYILFSFFNFPPLNLCCLWWCFVKQNVIIIKWLLVHSKKKKQTYFSNNDFRFCLWKQNKNRRDLLKLKTKQNLYKIRIYKDAFKPHGYYFTSTGWYSCGNRRKFNWSTNLPYFINMQISMFSFFFSINICNKPICCVCVCARVS